MLNQRGLTLVEILVATVIIAIGLIGLAMAIPISNYGVYQGNALSTATFLAEQRIEQVRNAEWTCPDGAGGGCSTPPPTANDCLGLSTTSNSTIGSAPASTSTTWQSAYYWGPCTRQAPQSGPPDPVCSSSSSCTTYVDEAAVTGYPGYSRTVRIYSCGTTITPNTTAGCAGVTDGRMRLVRVTVSYHPISGVGGTASGATNSAVVEMVIAERQ